MFLLIKPPFPDILIPCTVQQLQTWFVLGFRGGKESEQVVEAGPPATGLKPGLRGCLMGSVRAQAHVRGYFHVYLTKVFTKSPGNAAFLARNDGKKITFQDSQTE